jgi:glucose-1-phosphate cytidylyltransferase
MKAVILAGGFGTRISEESAVRPKPMITIGGHPILWHVMSIYAAHGIRDFVICCGYKGGLIRKYFDDYVLHGADVTYDLGGMTRVIHRREVADWRVTCVETGESTMTGGRLKRAAAYLDGGSFCMTYGDGVSNVDIGATLEFHKQHGKLATLTAVQSPGRFGAFMLNRDGDGISSFREKPMGDGAWINGGFFVLEPGVIELIDGEDTVWEREPLERLAADGELMAWKHDGFWQAMDTLRDRIVLEEHAANGDMPWLEKAVQR